MDDKPDPKKLEEKAKELSDREQEMKAVRRSELEEQEKSIERKHLSQLVEEERQRIEKGEGEDTPVGEKEFWDEREKEGNVSDGLTEERKRLEENMSKLQQRFHEGQIGEDEFRKLMDTYQRELVEVNVSLKKAV